VATLYLVRHGETTFNAEGRIQGHLDAPLTELGLRQAEAISRRLKSDTFAAVYSSDLGRASVTAEIIARPHGLPVNATPLLREVSLGVIEGLTRAEVAEKYPAGLHVWRQEPTKQRPPGGETLEQVARRCAEFLECTLPHHAASDRLLLVCHGGSMRGVIISALGLPVAAYRMLHFSNASLTILGTGERAGLWLLNDTCHLRSMTTDEEVDEIAG